MSSDSPSVYLDHHATTPLDPRVLEAMLPYLTEHFGNASSAGHKFGWKAAEAVAAAREQVARLVGAETKEVIFTSGATESTNLALTGAWEAARAKVGPQAGRNSVVTFATEHKATLDTVTALESRGAHVALLPVNPDGRLDTLALEGTLTSDTLMVSLLLANNEIGTIQPVELVSAAVDRAGALLHVDGAQAAGRVPIDLRQHGIDLLSLSAHKMYGPKGVGALVIRRRTPRIRLAEQIHGGGHERGLRSGTLNVPGIVGMGAACALALAALDTEAARTRQLRDLLLHLLYEALGTAAIRVNGTLENRLPNNLNVSFRGIEGESLIARLRDVAVSSGSACTSSSPAPSHVLTAIGLSPEEVHSSIRFGLGRTTTEAEIVYAARRIADEVTALRRLAP